MSITNKLELGSDRRLQESGIPKFLILLFSITMWERFSYYGMRALLVLFLTSELGFADPRAYAIYSLFAALGYAGPAIGGFLADKLLGFRNMVLIGGIIITLGHAAMTMVSLDSEFVYFGLGLIAVGTGMFKGNSNSLLGACYKDNDTEREKGFTLFYVGVNLGSFLSSILCGYVAHLYGWHYGFGLAGIGMTIGLITFVIYQDILGNNGLSPRQDLMKKRIFGFSPFAITFLGCLALAFVSAIMLMSSEFFANILALTGSVIVAIFLYIIAKSSGTERRNMLALLVLIFFMMCFFALEMQLGSLISLFTERNVDNEIFGIVIPAAVSQALNPLAIIILGTFMSTYMKFDSGRLVLQYAIGLGTLVACFLILYVGCLSANDDGKVGYLYLALSMVAMSLGELCVAPIVHAQASILAPAKIRGFVMGIVMLSLAFSNLLGIVLAKFMSVPSVDGAVNSLESLTVYRDGFLHIVAFNLGVVVVFLLFAPFLQRVLSAYKQ